MVAGGGGRCQSRVTEIRDDKFLDIRDRTSHHFPGDEVSGCARWTGAAADGTSAEIYGDGGGEIVGIPRLDAETGSRSEFDGALGGRGVDRSR